MSDSSRAAPGSFRRVPVHTPVWTPEQIACFWDNYGSIPHFRRRFFSLAWSEGILDFVARFLPTRGVVLDYGCGRGDLLTVLLRRGYLCLGCDSSIENVRATHERHASHAGFLGASLAPGLQLPRPDIVTMVEMLEHVPRAAAPELLGSVGALLPVGGHIVVTCPNQEDLAAAEVLCPDCGCCFHPVQHLQSLSPDDVASVAASAGFTTVFAGATRFRKTGERRAQARLIAMWYSLFGRPPHLVYVGRKCR